MGYNQLTFVPGIAKPNELVKNLTLSMDMMILVPNKHFWIIAGTLIIMLALSWLLTKTKIGKGMKMLSDSPELAKVSGIDVEVIVKATWCVGGFCAVAAGCFISYGFTNVGNNNGISNASTDVRSSYFRGYWSCRWSSSWWTRYRSR